MIGWVQISRRDVARAEQALLGDVKGVRDEIGVLSIHQAIADRLFPGTSVLHTRLRYALFVPWMMQRAARQSHRPPALVLRDLEVALTGQLLNGAGLGEPQSKGIIGGRVYRDPAAQPPSFSYWTALSRWGIVAKVHAGASRETVLRLAKNEWSAGHKLAKDEQGHSLGGLPSVFANLPDEPDGFLAGSQPMTFQLTADEHVFLRHRLMSVRRHDEAPSLLARLGGTNVDLETDSPWTHPHIIDLADEADRKVLVFARGVSALAGICRGAYLCMVEEACRKNRIADNLMHRERLRQLVVVYGDDARQLDLISMAHQDLGFAPGDRLFTVLEQTQLWLSKPGGVAPLTALYASAESSRKRGRARLANTPPALARLADWAKHEGTALAEPLHFRWPNVKRLLRDLHQPEPA